MNLEHVGATVKTDSVGECMTDKGNQNEFLDEFDSRQ